MRYIAGIFLLVLVLLAAGCSKKAEVIEQPAAVVEETASAESIAIANNISGNILSGLNTGNYAMFSMDFSERTKESMDEAYFNKLKQFVKENSGDYVSKTLAFSKGNTQFGYDAQFSKENVLLGLTLTSDLTKVETLYLDSENMRNRLASNLDIA